MPEELQLSNERKWIMAGRKYIFVVVLLCLTVYPLNALSKDKREIEITSIGMKFVYIPPFEESIVFGFYL